MEVVTRIKKVGAQNWQNVKIKLPDSVAPYLEKYDMELIEYTGDPYIGIFFQKKDNPDVDVVSCTVHNQNTGDNMSQGFKKAFEHLKILESEET